LRLGFRGRRAERSICVRLDLGGGAPERDGYRANLKAPHHAIGKIEGIDELAFIEAERCNGRSLAAKFRPSPMHVIEKCTIEVRSGNRASRKSTFDNSAPTSRGVVNLDHELSFWPARRIG
jgi:hypothetical protein